ncbi:MAG: uracil-DNA glycosylase [Patescibacteria group bacterium]
MNKKVLLNKLKDELIKDRKLSLIESRIIFGEGNFDSKVIFIGEAPGAKEEELGRPFVGRSGKLLEANLDEIGLGREDVYITNIVKKRPPDNRDPDSREIALFSPYLKREIDIIKPKIIVSLGRFSLQYFLPGAKISKIQGELINSGDYLIFPVFHPAAALRSSSRMADFKNSFKKLKKHLN